MSKLILFVAIQACAMMVYAQVDLQDLRPTFNYSYVYAEDTSVVPEIFGVPQLGKGLFYMAQFNSVQDPLTWFDANGGDRKNIVDKLSTIALGAWWAKSETFGLGADIGISSVDFGEASSQTGIGDLRLQFEKMLKDWRTSGYGASVTGAAYLPTGEKAKFLSNNSLGLSLGLNLEKQFSLLRTAFNINYLHYADAIYRNIDLEREVDVALGFHIPFGKKFTLNLEGTAIYLVNEEAFSGPGEVYLGGTHSVAYNGSFYWGASLSNIAGDDSSSIRTVAGFKFMPGATEPKVQPIEIERIETIKIIDRCGPEPKKVDLRARRLTTAEMKKMKQLPYLSTADHPIATQQLGEMTGEVQGQPYVEGSHVLFAVDLKGLPQKSDILELKNAKLKMSVRKLASADHSKNTEILCLLNDKVCSGELYDDLSWKNNINQQFFHDKETPNDYFMKLFNNKPTQNIDGKQYFVGEITVDLDKVVENSLVRGSMAIFYKEDSRLNGTLYFAVADDTYISSQVQLEVDLIVDSCKMAKSTKTIERKSDGKTTVEKIEAK